jgi:hypothetical protein
LAAEPAIKSSVTVQIQNCRRRVEIYFYFFLFDTNESTVEILLDSLAPATLQIIAE